jgi:hypothetical protein
VKPYKLLLKSADTKNAFTLLGDAEKVPPPVIQAIECFVCAMYAMPHITSVDEAGKVIFKKNYAPKDKSIPFDRIKGILMPVCYQLAQLCEKFNTQAMWHQFGNVQICRTQLYQMLKIQDGL